MAVEIVVQSVSREGGAGGDRGGLSRVYVWDGGGAGAFVRVCADSQAGEAAGGEVVDDV